MLTIYSWWRIAEFVYGEARHCLIPRNVRNVITCAYIWGVRDRSRGLNSNMFLCRGNCFARLRKKQSTCFGSIHRALRLVITKVRVRFPVKPEFFFFFNCLGCLFNCEDHIFFPLSYLYPQIKIWVILLMKLLINQEKKYHSLFKTWVAERKLWQHFPYQPTVWFLWGALYTQHLSYTCIVIRRTKILWILEVLLVVSKTK